MSERQSMSFSGPLYEQVHKVLRSRIQAGEWEPREPMPGEADLSRELGVSIGTVRKAMDQLTRDNIVIRERGRGTFVREVASRQSRIFELCGQDGQPVSATIQLLEAKTVAPTVAEAAALGLRNHRAISPRILRLKREWLHEGAVLGRETITVEATRFPGLGELLKDAGETLFQIYEDHYRTKIGQVVWMVGEPETGKQPSPAQPAIAEGKQLQLRRTAFDTRGLPIEIAELLVGAERCRVQILR